VTGDDFRFALVLLAIGLVAGVHINEWVRRGRK
jgi:hypothetical protein